MIPAAFEYARAGSVQEAASLLQKHGEDAKVLAGGHSLIPLMRLRLAQPSALIDINGVKELDYIHVEGGRLRLGALTRHVTIQHSPEVRQHLPLLA
nr:FAD binding domain-containing protein [Candidatus Dormibacteraeota bacterium]